MARLAMVVLWPSFLVAIAAEGVFFSLVDPRDLFLLGGLQEVKPVGIYTIGFFSFWLFGALASMLTWFLTAPTAQEQRVR